MPESRTKWGARLLLVVVGAGLLIMAAQDYFEYLSGRARLTSIATSILGHDPTSPAAAVERIQDALVQRLRPWPPGEAEKRPFLRDPAESLWDLRLGKCGDGSRLMIQLLAMRHLAARRVLLYDESGVTINAGFEYQDHDAWIYEGAFNSLRAEIKYTREHPAGIRDFLSGDNPVARHYKAFSYLNFRRLGIHGYLTHPLPQWLGYLFETPTSIKMFSCLFGALVCLPLWYVTMRMQGVGRERDQ